MWHAESLRPSADKTSHSQDTGGLTALLAQLKSTKTTSKSSFSLQHIEGSKQCSASDRPSQRHVPQTSGPRSPTCHCDVATPLATSRQAPELAIKVPPSSPKCHIKHNPRGEAHPWVLGGGLLGDHWVFLGGNEVGGSEGEGNWLLHSVHLHFPGEWLEEKIPSRASQKGGRVSQPCSNASQGGKGSCFVGRMQNLFIFLKNRIGALI